MHLRRWGVAAGIWLAMLSGCQIHNGVVTDLRAGDSSQTGVMNGPAAAVRYRYNGEKYHHVTVQWTDELAANPEAVAQLKALYLDKAIVNHLLKHQLYDRSADQVVAVMIDSFGYEDMKDLKGTVTLKQKDGRVLASFRIDTGAGYILSPYGGMTGSPVDQRIGYLSGEFGELTATTILNPESIEQPAPGAER